MKGSVNAARHSSITPALEQSEQLIDLVRSDEKSLYAEMRRADGKARGVVQMTEQMLMEAEQAQKNGA